MALTQSHYRFGINELAESTHGWHAAEDANPAFGVIPVDTTFLLRVTLQSTGVAQNNTDPEFQYRKNGGTWTQITTSTSNVKAVTPSCWADAANTTQRLSGTGTFIGATGCTVDGIAGGTAFDIPASGNGETECALQLVGANLVAGDTIEFRLTRDGAVLIDTYSVTPTLGIPLAPAAIVESSRWFNRMAGAAAGAAIIAAGLFGDTVKLTDVVSAELLPPSNLSVQVGPESVRALEWVYGAARNTQVDLATGVMEAPFHLSDAPLGVGGLGASASEDVKAGASGRVELIGLGNPIKCVDGPVSAALVGGAGDLSRALTDEVVKVADAVVPALQLVIAVPAEALTVVDLVVGRTLDPEQAAPSDALKVADTDLSVALVDAGSLTVTKSEAVTVSDTLSVQLPVLATSLSEVVTCALDGELELLSGDGETVRVAEAILGPTLFDGIETAISESVKCAIDGYAEIISDGETVYVADALTELMDTSGPSETVKVRASGFVELIGLGNPIRCVDGPVSAALVAAGLAVQVTDESVKVADGPVLAALVVVGFTVQVADEPVKVTDQGPSAQLTVLLASLTEPVKCADAVGATMQGAGLLPNEVIKVSDAALSAGLTPLLPSALQELVHGGDEGEVELVTDETVKVSDTLSAALVSASGLSTSLSEAVKCADALSAALVSSSGLTTSLSEAVVVEDSGQVQLVHDETVKVSDTIAATLSSPLIDLTIAITPETLHISEALALTLNPEQTVPGESVKVVDTVTAAVQLAVVVGSESLKVVDGAVSTLLNPLEAAPSESVKVADGGLFVSVGSALPVPIPDAVVRISDTVTVVLTTLQGSAAEAVKVAEVLAAQLNPIQGQPSETIKVVDQVVASIVVPDSTPYLPDDGYFVATFSDLYFIATIHGVFL